MKRLLLLSLGASLLSATSGFADSAPPVIWAGGGNDAVRSLGGRAQVCGGPRDDVVFGGAGNDTLNGGYGNDRLYGATAKDAVNGGPGWDRCGAEREENCEAR